MSDPVKAGQAEVAAAQPVDDTEFSSARRTLAGWQGVAWRYAAAIFVAWHMWILLVMPADPTVSRAVHVFLGAVLGFALFAPSVRAAGNRVPWYDWLLMVPCVLIVAHYVMDADGIEMRSFMGPNWRDVAVAIGGILIVLEFARRSAGLAMPIIAGVFIAYCFLGPWMPGMLYHRGVDLEQAAVELFGNNGVLGTIVQVSSTFIIMFVTFACFLQTSRAGDYFNELALGLVGWARGGQAKVAVVSSFMFGTVSGSSVANVVASGTFTIPMMKRGGYDRETAGAVEATASTGGQLAPPVMGAGAFIMAEVIGRPYTEIALAGVIPALLFYFAVYTHCDLHARKTGLHGLPRSELPSLVALAKRVYMLAPLVILIAILVQGYSPFRAAAWGIAAALVIMAATFLLHGLLVQKLDPVRAVVGTVMQLVHGTIEALAGSAREVMQLIAVCATAGIVAGVIGLTGVGGRFASLLLAIASGLPLLALMFAMVVAIILGMGVPTTAAYAIAAAVVAPGLIDMGVPALSAHMFIFYFAVLSAITPPVALASFAAAGLAGGDMWKTSMKAVKFGLATFIVPYMFWMSPALLGQGETMAVAQAVFTATLGVFLLASATEGWMFRAAMTLPVRVVSGVAALMLMVPEAFTDIAGLVVGLGIIAWQWRHPPTPVASTTPLAARS
ncbi:TRAP transporter permease [Roseomonas sp. AR75]|uniref:TRAP transporter permease n=1 Tax=Roseomonas sp. AR75 TaxID=2562311 RepID=UPI001485474E|nr:TRAP transporter permease [Roseomonas sp. AR75]